MTVLRSVEEAIPLRGKAPEFMLKNMVDEKMVSLSDFEGKAIAVIFMCNHCPFVIPKFEEIGALMQEYVNKGMVVIGISANDAKNYPADAPGEMTKIAKQYGFTYYLYDETQEVARAYNAVCTPDTFVFDKDHKLVFHGRINDALSPDDPVTEHTLKEVIKLVLAGEEFKQWFLPSQGCNIKWKHQE